MRGRLDTVAESEYGDRELDLYAEFSEAARDGKNPDVEEYLRRLPEAAATLRPDLEGVVKVCAAIRKLEAVYSAEELARGLDSMRGRRRG
jgi:uncharacterized Fe-S cluster-containing protein